MEMGFTEEQCQDALKRYDGNENAATTAGDVLTRRTETATLVYRSDAIQKAK